MTQGEPASIDFVRNELDLVARARVVNPSASEEGKELIDLKDVTIPVHVRGTSTSRPYRAVEGSHRRHPQAQPREQARDAVTGKGKGGAAVDKALKGLLGR